MIEIIRVCDKQRENKRSYGGYELTLKEEAEDQKYRWLDTIGSDVRATSIRVRDVVNKWKSRV